MFFKLLLRLLTVFRGFFNLRNRDVSPVHNIILKIIGQVEVIDSQEKRLRLKPWQIPALVMAEDDHYQLSTTLCFLVKGSTSSLGSHFVVIYE